MTPPKGRSNGTQVLIEYKFTEVFKRLDRIEDKVDNSTYVKQADFDKIISTLATKEEVSPIKKFYYGFLAAFGAGVIGFVFYLLQRAVGA